ncbi:plastocyanin/azurin family copper-binding protein [Haladaptatus halobius]|uniref:plastocyanin/azurin family copper-binding protein n=1 Tax=Haladaptatus halobius TaxID=2884875 RepID=UPI001D0B9388|nr:plastocyanin/azurin family copper-binding protein [Haladaptatus halobius]
MTDRHADRDGGATRRAVLQAFGAAGIFAGASDVTGAQETTRGISVEGTPLILGGEVKHWFGLAPSQIHGKENPDLRLRAGRTYTLVWINIDGKEHEFIVEDSNGNELAATESASAPGATRHVTFTAKKEMSRYYCEYHPKSMRGNVTLGGGFRTTGT